MAMSSGEVEEIGMLFVKRELDCVVLDPSGSGDEAKLFETLGNGLELLEFHSGVSSFVLWNSSIILFRYNSPIITMLLFL